MYRALNIKHHPHASYISIMHQKICRPLLPLLKKMVLITACPKSKFMTNGSRIHSETLSVLWIDYIPNKCGILEQNSKGSMQIKKKSQKVEEVHNFLDSLPSGCFGLFLNLGKIENLMTPPLRPNLGKIWKWENFEFWDTPPPQKKKHKLITLEIA